MIPDRNRRSRPTENRPMKPPSCSLICSLSNPPWDSGATQISERKCQRNSSLKLCQITCIHMWVVNYAAHTVKTPVLPNVFFCSNPICQHTSTLVTLIVFYHIGTQSLYCSDLMVSCILFSLVSQTFYFDKLPLPPFNLLVLTNFWIHCFFSFLPQLTY